MNPIAFEKKDNNGKQQYTIALPCEESQFNNFIGSLLGKPQTIEKNFDGRFELTKNDITDVYYLVTQRIQQQNRGNLIQFSVQLTYNDNSSVILNSLESFISHTEIKPLIVIKVDLSWIFLVKFEDKEHPEKQTIDLSFISRNSRAGRYIIDFDHSPSLSINSVFLRINHTARTWGSDIESLISGFVQQVIIDEHPFRVFIRRHSNKIANIVMYFTLVITIILAAWTVDHAITQQIADIEPLIKNSNVNDKVNKILQLLIGGFGGKLITSIFIYGIIVFAFIIIIGEWIKDSARARKPSFILLTKKSEELKTIEEKSYKSKLNSFILSICISIFTGFVSNILFLYIWK